MQVQEACDNFFRARTITVEKQIHKRKFVPPFVAGSLLKKANQEILSAIESKKSKLTTTKAVPEKCQAKTLKLNKTNTQKSKQTNTKKSKITKYQTVNNSKVPSNLTEPNPSTSGLNMRKDAHIDLNSEDSCDSDIFNGDDDLCCVCNRWDPKELQLPLLLPNGPNVTFVHIRHILHIAQRSDL